MNYVVEDILMHYGVKRRSGRYPYGSGKDPYQHGGDFLSRVDELRDQNFTFTDDSGEVFTGDTAIAKSMNLSTTQFRAQLSYAGYERRSQLVSTAKALKEHGYSNTEIARRMGFNNESSVRALLNTDAEARMNKAMKTAEYLKKQVDEKGMVDVGKGVDKSLGVSREKLNEALAILEMQGYPTFGGGVPQVTNPGQQTNLKVLCPPGSEHKDIYQFDKIHSVKDFKSQDDGETFDPAWVYPKSLDSKRVKVRYAEDGGIEKDGVVEIRRGVNDISLGESKYAQVRILVDGTHYIKGMAVYSDDMPPGTDLIFNTNKTKGTPMCGPKGNTVLKPIKNDPNNPFGSLIKEGIEDPDNPLSKGGGQRYYYDENGKKQLSVINKRSEEGDWGQWSNKLSSQFLSKQSKHLIDRQLGLAKADKYAEFDEICNLTNPTVKKRLLKSFADDCDSAAVHLHAAALPRQKYQVILPLTSMKDNEVYAPNYKNGETVALVRYPHGGTFEIPILKVNNKNRQGIDILGKTPADAIGINAKVAERLSGADFDGDTVMVIPTGGKTKITSTPALKGLEGFDPKMAYPYRKGMREMKNTQNEMGRISNLITDMTLQGAAPDELARAVRHSMVVIDAEKHRLNYKQSEIDNGIDALKNKYQGHYDENGRYKTGSSTLISRAKSQTSVAKRKGQGKPNIPGKPWYDPNRPDGALIFKTAKKNVPGSDWYDPKKPINSMVYTYDNDIYQVKKKVTDSNGRVTYKPVYNADGTPKMKARMQQSTAMAETDDARTLISRANTAQERSYAEYANSMKSLANNARMEEARTGKIEYNKEANKKYKLEVDSLMAQLAVSEQNAPRERQAQTMANAKMQTLRKEYPDMTKAEAKKWSQQALVEARLKVGAKRTPVQINEREWEAIQAGAISETKLKQILDHTDIDKIKELATPRTRNTLSQAKQNHIATLYASGYTTSEIASKLNVSTETVLKYLKE